MLDRQVVHDAATDALGLGDDRHAVLETGVARVATCRVDVDARIQQVQPDTQVDGRGVARARVGGVQASHDARDALLAIALDDVLAVLDATLDPPVGLELGAARFAELAFGVCTRREPASHVVRGASPLCGGALGRESRAQYAATGKGKVDAARHRAADVAVDADVAASARSFPRAAGACPQLQRLVVLVDHGRHVLLRIAERRARAVGLCLECALERRERRERCGQCG